MSESTRGGEHRVRAVLVGLVGLVGASLLAGCAAAGGGGSDDSGAAAQVSTPKSDFRGTEIHDPYPLPDQSFTDTGGEPYVPAEDATAAVTLVFFGYTHCPDVCNIVLANVASALRGSPAEVQERTRLVFVTTDPERDTPAVVRDYLDRFDESYVGLTAPLPTVLRAAKSMYIAYGGTEDAHDGGYEVSHGTQLTAFVGGGARVLWSAETPVGDLRADLARLSALTDE